MSPPTSQGAAFEVVREDEPGGVHCLNPIEPPVAAPVPGRDGLVLGAPAGTGKTLQTALAAVEHQGILEVIETAVERQHPQPKPAGHRHQGTVGRIHRLVGPAEDDELRSAVGGRVLGQAQGLERIAGEDRLAAAGGSEPGDCTVGLRALPARRRALPRQRAGRRQHHGENQDEADRARAASQLPRQQRGQSGQPQARWQVVPGRVVALGRRRGEGAEHGQRRQTDQQAPRGARNPALLARRQPSGPEPSKRQKQRQRLPGEAPSRRQQLVGLADRARVKRRPVSVSRELAEVDDDRQVGDDRNEAGGEGERQGQIDFPALTPPIDLRGEQRAKGEAKIEMGRDPERGDQADRRQLESAAQPLGPPPSAALEFWGFPLKSSQLRRTSGDHAMVTSSWNDDKPVPKNRAMDSMYFRAPNRS